MAVHAICPSLRCRKILTLPDEARGTVVKCRYCEKEFRIPAPRQVAPSASRMVAATSAGARGH